MAKFKAASVRHFTNAQKAKMREIALESIQDLCAEAQRPKADGGRMPVVEGTLRNSFEARLNGGGAQTGALAYVAVLANLKLGDRFRARWTAAYARRVNSGFVGEDVLGRTFNQQGAFFLEGAGEQWPAIVKRNAAKVKD